MKVILRSILEERGVLNERPNGNKTIDNIESVTLYPCGTEASLYVTTIDRQHSDNIFPVEYIDLHTQIYTQEAYLGEDETWFKYHFPVSTSLISERGTRGGYRISFERKWPEKE